MKKVLVTIVLAIFVIVSASAQTQSGYVKTKGRMDKSGNLIPGTRIGGAAITLTGGHSTVADANGDFTLAVPDKKFFLKSVQKQGYVLTDPDILSKQYVCSANPLAISMETPQQQMRDQIEAQKKIEATLREQLAQREKELEALRKAHKLTEEDYYRKLQQLYDEKATQELVKEMSKRYSEIDYDLIDSFQRQFSTYILSGELAQADSLLKTKGNLTGDINELHRLETANAVERAELERRRARLDSSISYAQWLMEDIAVRCESKAEIFKLRYMNDSAAYYLELRAGLDTTNVVWQLMAGLFINDYLADYNKAMTYYQRALRQSILQNGDFHPDVATSYNNIGSVYAGQGDYAHALEYLQKALSICKSVYGDGHPDVAASYNNIGMVYKDQGNYAQALEYLQKALSIWKSVHGENHPNVATCYNNIGVAHWWKWDYAQALEYFQKALAIRKTVLGENHPNVAASHNNIGMVYKHQGNYTQALEYLQKALSICKSVYGENHPNVATCYNNIGTTYEDQGDYAQAMEYHQKSLAIKKSTYGENHPDVALSYSNIGSVFYAQGDYAKAQKYYQKSLSIRKTVLGESHPDVAAGYNAIGEVYDAQGKYDQALEYYQKALAIRKTVLGENHPEVADSYISIGIVYYKQSKYAQVLEYLQKGYSILKLVYGESNPNVQSLKGVIDRLKILKKQKKKKH